MTSDQSTMPTHLAHHLHAGHHSPGIFMIRPHFSLPRIVEHLVLAAYAGDPAEWLDRIEYIPY